MLQYCAKEELLFTTIGLMMVKVIFLHLQICLRWDNVNGNPAIFLLEVSQTVPSKSHNVSSSENLPTNPVPDQDHNPIVMEHNYAEYPSSSNSTTSEIKDTETESVLNQEIENTSVGITIKLKYINDDLKLVEGKLDELLGDFKK